MASATLFNVTHVTNTNPYHLVQMYGTVLLIIRYTCAVPTCWITAVCILPPTTSHPSTSKIHPKLNVSK